MILWCWCKSYKEEELAQVGPSYQETSPQQDNTCSPETEQPTFGPTESGTERTESGTEEVEMKPLAYYPPPSYATVLESSNPYAAKEGNPYATAGGPTDYIPGVNPYASQGGYPVKANALPQQPGI